MKPSIINDDCNLCLTYSLMKHHDSSTNPLDEIQRAQIILDFLLSVAKASRDMHAYISRLLDNYSHHESVYSYPVNLIKENPQLTYLKDQYYRKWSSSKLNCFEFNNSRNSIFVEDTFKDIKECCINFWFKKELILELFDELPKDIFRHILQIIVKYKERDSCQNQDNEFLDWENNIQDDKDIFEVFPINVSKHIISYLEEVDLKKCIHVNSRWKRIAEEVQEERVIIQKLFIKLYSYKRHLLENSNPNWCIKQKIAIPLLENDKCIPETLEDQGVSESEAKFDKLIVNCKKNFVFVEEHNAYCGEYNLLVVYEGIDTKRVISKDLNIDGKLLSISTKKNKPMLIDVDYLGQSGSYFYGHAGSVTGLLLDEQHSFLISSSYDASIRKWSLVTNRYLKIYNGHNDMVLSIAMHGPYLVSGSHDKSCKVWRHDTGECLWTLWHKNAVSAVAVHGDMCISGCTDACLRVWQISTGKFIKGLFGHHAEILGVAMDAYFIVTCARENVALVWSAVGNYKKQLTRLEHPKYVLCVGLKYLCAITGCQDGRIRIFDMETGTILRILLSRNLIDPVTQIFLSENQILVNTPSRVLLMKFAPIKADPNEHKFCQLKKFNTYSELNQKSNALLRCRKLLLYRNEYLQQMNMKLKHIKEYKMDNFFGYLKGVEKWKNLQNNSINANKCKCDGFKRANTKITLSTNKTKNINENFGPVKKNYTICVDAKADKNIKLQNGEILNQFTHSKTAPLMPTPYRVNKSMEKQNLVNQLTERYKDKNLSQSTQLPYLKKSNTAFEFKSNRNTSFLNTNEVMKRSNTIWLA